MTKIKKIKSEPLFDKQQLKSAKERISQYSRVLKPEFLDELLSMGIDNLMLKNYLRKNGVNINEIEKEYSKEIEKIYLTLIPERYKKQKAFHKKLIKTLNEGKYKKTKKLNKKK